MFSNRKNIIQFVFILVGLVYVIKLFFLQILDSSYKLASQDNVRRRIIDYPYRGLIYDRKGKLLVYNTPVFDLMIVPREVKVKDTAIFCRRFGITREDFITKISEAKKYSRDKPSAFIKQLSIKDFAKVQDFLVDYKGFYPQKRTVRSYPHNGAANALGYIGEISKRQLEKQTDDYYQQGDYIGISGMEAAYESYLRGKRGARYVMVNVRGVEKGAYKDGSYDTLSRAGINLTSTIDLDLQLYGEQLMKYKVGTVVAIEPSSGEILSFISSPSYDPNLLTGREFSKNYIALQKDSMVPLFNRPLMAMYPPGSIFKLAQALIGMDLGVVKPTTTFPCNKTLVNCHDHPSPQDVRGSVQHSCNPYYFMVFKSIIEQGRDASKFKDTELGYDIWYSKIKKFGFGEKLGVDLPNEKGGIIPSNKYYDRVYGDLRWKFSTIYSLAIGQGEIGIIPIQMANLAAIIANRGHYFTPHLVKSIGEKGPLPQYKVKHSVEIAPEHFVPVIDGMEQVVLAGTAARSKINHISMCGKTGTAQNPHGEDHSVFIAFAPKDTPRIAIAVFVENSGFGGTWAAPIASLMIEKYLTDTITRPMLEKPILEKKFYIPKNEREELQNQQLMLNAAKKDSIPGKGSQPPKKPALPVTTKVITTARKEDKQ
jgi:penicillin-binding protein 2